MFSKKERRDFMRVDKKVLASFSVKKGNPPAKAYTKNISGNGIQIETPAPPAENSILYIKLELPKLGEIVLEGQVAWSKKEGDTFQVGVHFFNIDKSDQALILNALENI
jgi:hypothetical protein